MPKKILAFVSGLMPTATAMELVRQHPCDQKAPAEGTFTRAAWEVAQDLGYAFIYIPIQDDENPNPTMAQMGQLVADDLRRAEETYTADPTIIASSVGANAFLQACGRTSYITPRHVITLEGVFDALSAIKLQLQSVGAGPAYDMLKATQIPQIDLPVNGTTGTFTLMPEHLLDGKALRLFDPKYREAAIQFLNKAFPNEFMCLPKLTNITAAENRLCPPSAVDAFSQVMAPYIDNGRDSISNIILPGDTVTQDQFRATLRQILAPAA